MGLGYADELGPPDWVSGPLASGGHAGQATERERSECEELEQAIASTGRATVAAPQPRFPG